MLLIIPHFLTKRKGIGTGWFYSVLGGGLTKDPNIEHLWLLQETPPCQEKPIAKSRTGIIGEIGA